jgi:GNAT superfamily N-acetyltransferase
MKAYYRAALLRQLAMEYNCTDGDLTRTENVLTRSALHPQRRAYSSEKYFFQMVTTGKNAVITADECLHPFLREFMADRPGIWLFELPNLRPLEEELNRYGYTLMGTFHMFLPAADVTPRLHAPVRWFAQEQIAPFYGDARFPNAILDTFHPERPDRLVVCAMDGNQIMGMAGCSEDAPGWMQIGIDVMPEYRSRGVGTYLVTLLKNRIMEMGDIPFYGTSASNYHSWNIALNSGFRPAWVEVGAMKQK